MNPSDTILDVKNLRTSFFLEEGVITPVDGVSFSINRGETLAVVGESGCGKSVTALSVIRLIRYPPGRIIGGEVLLEGNDLLKKTEKEMRRIRGNQISMVFQEPMTSLNPVFTAGDQITEVLRLHKKITKGDALKKARDMLELTGIPLPARRLKEYPHQLSGGMKQRVMIAMALSCQPKLLIADEPTTALDVTIQAQILDIMRDLKKKMGMSILLITHDLGVVAEMASRVIVMYAGKIVEEALVDTIFDQPLHPYTEGLLKSVPQIGMRERLHVIPGVVPDPSDFSSGCRFHSRCPYTFKRCLEEEPPLFEVSASHTARCWLREGLAIRGVS